MSLADAIGARKPKAAKVDTSAESTTHTTDEHKRKYALAALEKECSELASTRAGERNHRLNAAAFSLGQLVGADALSEREVKAALRTAAKSCGLTGDDGETATEKTIASGLKGGMSEPRDIPPPKPKRERAHGNGATTEPPDDGWMDAEVSDPDRAEADEARVPQPGPTADEPLRGLQHLGPIALVGLATVLELARRPIVYVWHEIAVAGTVVLIAGPPAEGKTTLLFLVLVARAGNAPLDLLGRRIEPAPAGKWLVLIEGEHSEASTARKLVKSVRLLGVDEAALGRVIVVARKAVRLGSPEWLDIELMIAEGLVSDIAIDTLARVAPGDANDEREQVAIYDQIASAIEKAPKGTDGPIVWTVAHTRKTQTGGLADVSGSAQRTGQADTVLMISGEKIEGRTVSTKVVFQKLREDPDDYPLPYSFAIVTDPATGEPALRGEHPQAEDDRPLEERILDQLKLGPRTAGALSKTLGRSYKDVQAALSALFDAREITSTSTKVGGRDRKAFELRGASGSTRRSTRRGGSDDEHATSDDETTEGQGTC